MMNRKKRFLDKLNIDSYSKFIKTLSVNNLNNKIEMLIPELVLCELISHQKRFLKEILSEGKSKDDIDIDEIKNMDLDKYCTYLKNSYKDKLNIIRIPDNKEKLFNTIFKRALDKTPPFSKKSDPGFKDTILFLSILEFSKTKNFDKYILITNDERMIEKKEDLKKEFLKYNNSEVSLDIKRKNEFKNWSNDEFNLFVDLRTYLEDEFYDKIQDKYYYTSTISWGNGDTEVENYELLKDDTEFYQFDDNEYEVIIYLRVQINRSQDAAIGEFYSKDDEYFITQQEVYSITKVKKNWVDKLKSSTYDIYYLIMDENFMQDEYPNDHTF